MLLIVRPSPLKLTVFVRKGMCNALKNVSRDNLRLGKRSGSHAMLL